MIFSNLYILSGTVCLIVSATKLSLGQKEITDNCSKGVEFTFGESCNLYVTCTNGKLDLKICPESRIYDYTVRMCVKGAITGCHPILSILKSINTFSVDPNQKNELDEANLDKGTNFLIENYLKHNLSLKEEDSVKINYPVSESSIDITDYTSMTGTEWSELSITTDRNYQSQESTFDSDRFKLETDRFEDELGSLPMIDSKVDYFKIGLSPGVSLTERSVEELFTDEAYQSNTDVTGMTVTDWLNSITSSDRTENPFHSTTNNTQSMNPTTKSTIHTTAKETKPVNYTTYTTMKPTSSVTPNITQPTNHTKGITSSNTTPKSTGTSNNTTPITIKTTTSVTTTKGSHKTTKMVTTNATTTVGVKTTTLTSTTPTTTTVGVETSTLTSTPETSESSTQLTVASTKKYKTSTLSTTTKPTTVKFLWPFDYDYNDESPTSTNSTITTSGQGYKSINNYSKFSILFVTLLVILNVA